MWKSATKFSPDKMQTFTSINIFAGLLVFPALLLLQFTPINAADADPLQDYCVADLTKDLYLNGYPCKNPAAATTEDFVFYGFMAPPQTNNTAGAVAITAEVDTFAGLNSLGLTFARLDFARGGVITPHAHPRASEIIYVTEGSLYAGFVTTSNKLFAKVITKSEVMIFPRGLIHFQLNVGETPAQAVVALNSQYPGFQFIGDSMFGSNIKDEVLEKTFFLDQTTVDRLKAIFSGSA
ncbi:hypothetical protein O6H91_05G092800 [Diphasiastrum complanatum]|uniref:Uncharacterized protein n=1 Tax=Diphasiastrum complanatum TaxID=34168 RepID=A0ACC2DQW2_DIPCM|nr:hypothetical protein O6H91_Y233500 [Diphasiastrum complanatum]KAJ7296600.1 hypothetical protein O6H91_Y112900 [Diphasiastrum complanatum]KAJ7556666.1 hypothetical protein O6H91_05G092800 [Diphasiastrum complanatum]